MVGRYRIVTARGVELETDKCVLRPVLKFRKAEVILSARYLSGG
jgi:hypothetical protein